MIMVNKRIPPARAMPLLSNEQESTAPSRARVSEAERWLTGIDDRIAAKLIDSWHLAQKADHWFSVIFYQLLFNAHPEIAALFPGDMQQQQQRMTRTLGEAIDLSVAPDRLILLLKAAGVRHHHYRVVQAYFQLMEPVFLQALGRQLGDSFDDELQALWQKFFHNMTIVMRDAMAGTLR
jgi:hemoglobin-like flavoprotein